MLIGDPKGYVILKSKIEHSTNIFDSHSNYTGVLKVIDIARDESSYMVLNNKGTALADIDKRDVYSFVTVELMNQIKSAKAEIEMEELLNK